MKNVKNAAAEVEVEVKTVVTGEDNIQNEMIVVIMTNVILIVTVTVHIMTIHNRAAAAGPDMIQEMIVDSYKKQSCNEVILSRAKLHAWNPMVHLSLSRLKRQTSIPEKL